MDTSNTNALHPNNGFSFAPRIIGALLLLGLFYPTVEGFKFTALSVGSFIICFALLACLAFGRLQRPKPAVSILLLSMAPLLLVFTGVSGLTAIAWGGIVSYILLSVLYLTELNQIGFPKWLDNLWLLINCLNVAVGVAVVLGVEVINHFIAAYYSYSYEGLVSGMLLARRPVLMFASHSWAAFFHYLFFWFNLEAFKVKRQKIYLVLSICFLVLTICLLSVSGLVLFCLGFLQLLLFLWSSLRHKFVAVALVSALVVPIISFGPQMQWRELVQGAREILENPGSGLLGRYLPGGTLYYDLQYLNNHPFSPVGLSDREGLMFGDSGIVQYVLRGSLPLLLLVYGGFYYFLRRNLSSSRHARYLFIAFLIYETGMPTLTYFRTLALLPVFVVYLNSLDRGSHTVKF